MHVVISLIAIVAGIIVMFGMLGSNRMPGLTAIFLLITILTSATGLRDSAAPVRKVAAVAYHRHSLAGAAGDRLLRALRQKLSGAWRWIYVLTALVSLYFNVFVLVIQSFLKVPALHALAPGIPPSGPVFAVVQGIVLVFFAFMIIGAWRRFHPACNSVTRTRHSGAQSANRNLDRQHPDSGSHANTRVPE